MAVCLPLLIFTIFGSLELANNIHLKQVATAAAYEAARSVTNIGGTEYAARIRGEEILSSHGINDASITFSPAVTPSLPSGTVVNVQVNIPILSNLNGANVFSITHDIDVHVCMVRQ